MTDDTKWYYCLRHATAEEGAGCRAADRLGPYESRQAAEHALESAAERTRTEDRRDADWDDD
ncbi:hypothetical protein LO772_27825 [Yinghuangia sp. ASG 101]|uniref:hypothetical protein n=1 Tax=Yinghuangia sp. ASG 101 TaxID=2896848 RepID=UPI001E43A2CA|nr:hypothetical protein [Yinghuangia sp. ASG 101]UGQ10615.1 hypothetical protein LO772_27825 [Yinghuangia sp. ASG 101]